MQNTSPEQGTLSEKVLRLAGELRCRRPYEGAGLALAIIMTLSCVGSANAEVQWNPFKPGFGKQVAPEAQVERHPVAPPPSSLTSPKRQSAGSNVAREPKTPKTESATGNAPPASTAVAPLPPPRPSNLQAGALPPANTSSPPERAATRAAAVEAAKAAASTGSYPAPTSAADALARVNEWLNGYDAIQARFIQHNAQGQKAEGTLYVKRPGQLVFKYDAPSTLEIVADGKSVAVRDSKLRTNDVYSIGQTPLKFLLKDPVNLAKDTKLVNVSTDADGIVRVSATDSSTLGGTSQITLIFDSRANQLKQWNIVDPQGYRTTVALYNLRTTSR